MACDGVRLVDCEGVDCDGVGCDGVRLVGCEDVRPVDCDGVGCDAVTVVDCDGVGCEGVRLVDCEAVRLVDCEAVRLGLALRARAKVGRASAVSSESLLRASALPPSLRLSPCSSSLTVSEEVWNT